MPCISHYRETRSVSHWYNLSKGGQNKFMPNSVSDRLRERVWGKRLDVLVEHTFHRNVLTYLAGRAKRTKRIKTVATISSYPVYLTAMAAAPLFIGEPWFLGAVEALGAGGIFVSAISQYTGRVDEDARPVSEASKELSRLRDRFEDLWFFVDSPAATDELVQSWFSPLSDQLTEVTNRTEELQSKYGTLYSDAERYVYTTEQIIDPTR